MFPCRSRTGPQKPTAGGRNCRDFLQLFRPLPRIPSEFLTGLTPIRSQLARSPLISPDTWLLARILHGKAGKLRDRTCLMNRLPLRHLGLLATLLCAVAVPGIGHCAMVDIQGAAPIAAEAEFERAVQFEYAEGVGRDYSKAFALYCDASRLGHAQAAYNIGWMYANGRGVARNDDQAAAWFRLAEKRGHRHARQILKFILGGKPDAKPRCPDGMAGVESAAAIGAPAEISRLVARLAPTFRLSPALVLAVIKVESDFRADAVSPKDAQGLMQLIPETARRFGVKNAFDPAQNLAGGMAYLRWLLDRFGGNVRLALAAYNSGEKAVDRYDGVPPYPETQGYLRKLGRLGILPADDQTASR